MYKQLIDQFFKENGVKNDKVPSAPAIANFKIKMFMSSEASEKFSELIDGKILKSQPKRGEMVEAERREIESATTSEQIIRFMRRSPDIINESPLVKQALLFENEVIPEILKRLKTSLNTGFIETSTKILAASSINVAEDLIGYYDDVRSPYAQGMILVILGFKAKEAHIPWIIEKYKTLKKLYPNETYSDGAIYALDEIENRFYEEDEINDKKNELG